MRWGWDKEFKTYMVNVWHNNTLFKKKKNDGHILCFTSTERERDREKLKKATNTPNIPLHGMTLWQD